MLIAKKSCEVFSRDNATVALRIYPAQEPSPDARPAEVLAVELIIVIILVLLLFGSFPVFPYSRDWGYRGSGVLGTILLIVIILWALGRI